MTPLDMGLYNSFSFYAPPGCGRGRATPMTSVAGSHHVSSSIWHPPGLTSLSAMQALNAEQFTEILNLAAEFQALSTELAKQFQTLSGLEVMHHTTAQATAHTKQSMQGGWPGMWPTASCQMARLGIKNIRKPYSGSASRLTKGTNDLVFNHQLHYDGQLMAFISNAERTLQADRCGRCLT